MNITNIINVGINQQYGKYIQAINLINSIFKGTYHCTKNERDNDINLELLCVNLLRIDGNNDSIPNYVEKLMTNYCSSLKKYCDFMG